jgi:hypothetical protein
VSSYQRLVVSSGLSNLADGIFHVALPIVTLGVTRDPGAFAAVTLALRLPWLLFALPAGAYADRLDRRRTMLLISLGRAVVIGGLAAIVVYGGETLWLLCAAAFVLGMGETLFDTSAQSITPSVVPADDLSRANARLYAVELTANQFIGPRSVGSSRASPPLPRSEAVRALMCLRRSCWRSSADHSDRSERGRRLVCATTSWKGRGTSTVTGCCGRSRSSSASPI